MPPKRGKNKMLGCSEPNRNLSNAAREGARLGKPDWKSDREARNLSEILHMETKKYGNPEKT
jgi:hypothetical protein